MLFEKFEDISSPTSANQKGQGHNFENGEDGNNAKSNSSGLREGPEEEEEAAAAAAEEQESNIMIEKVIKEEEKEEELPQEIELAKEYELDQIILEKQEQQQQQSPEAKPENSIQTNIERFSSSEKVQRGIFYLMLFICIINFQFGNYFSYDSIGATSKYAQDYYGIGVKDIGILYSVWSTPNIFLCLFYGIIIDKIGMNL